MLQLAAEVLDNLHGEGVPDKDLWSLSQVTRSDRPAIGGEGDRRDLLAMLVEVALGVRSGIEYDSEASDMVGDRAVQQEFDVVPRLVALVAVDPIDGRSDMRGLGLVLRWLRVARRGLYLPSPGPCVEELLSLFVTAPEWAVVALPSSTSLLPLGLLGCSLGSLSSLGLPSGLLRPALVGEILL